MATRKSSLTSSLVQERRLRPIYDLLDAGHNKKALVEIDRLLRKTLPENEHLLHVVKALACTRLNRTAEAHNLLEYVIRMTEETGTGFMVGDTTQIMLTCYKELNQPHMICLILEHLCNKFPTEDMHIQFFMSLVRIQDFRKMQQVSLHLYKTFKKPPYFSWAIASLVLHYEYFIGPLDYNSTLNFQLAERMTEKFLADILMKGEGEEYVDNWHLLDLYAHLLGRQGKWDKVLTVLKLKDFPPSNLSSWIWDRDHVLYCYVLEQAGMKSELLKYLQDLFVEHKQYSLLKQIVDIFGKHEDMRSQVVALLDDLREKNASYGVAMGRLYFDSEMKKNEVPISKERLEDDLKMVIKYGIATRHFFPEAVAYFQLVDHASQCSLLDSMGPPLAPANITETKTPTSHEAIVKDIHYEFTRREVMGKVYDLPQRVWQANICFGKYLNLIVHKDNRLKSNLTPPPTPDENKGEIDPLDQYVLIAASILLSEYFKLEQKAEEKKITQMLNNVSLNGGKSSKEEDDKNMYHEELLMSATCIMQYCLNRSPLNCTLRLMLANAYAHQGATQEMLKVMQGVNIKHVQLDTLGYLIIPAALTSGLYQEAMLYLRSADMMYTNLDNETIEYGILSWDHCNFHKVSELAAFAEQLLHSAQCGLVLVEKRLLEFMTCTKSLGAVNDCARVALQELHLTEMMRIFYTDNRDLNILNHLFDDGIDWSAFRTTTAKIDLHWFKMRLCLLTAITWTTSMSTLAGGINADKIAELKKAVEFWKQFSEEWNNIPWKDKSLENSFYGIYPPRHVRHFELSIPNYFIQQANSVIKIFEEENPKATGDHFKDFQDIVTSQANELLKGLADDFAKLKKDASYKTVRNCITTSHFILEFFAFSKIFFTVAFTATKNAFSSENDNKVKGKKGKSGKKNITVAKSVLDSFHQLHKLLCDFSNCLKKRRLPNWPNNRWTEGTFITKLETQYLMEALPSTFIDVHKNIRDSHLDQIITMSRTAESLLQFIRNL